jgi:hypothetical protein
MKQQQADRFQIRFDALERRTKEDLDARRTVFKEVNQQNFSIRFFFRSKEIFGVQYQIRCLRKRTREDSKQENNFKEVNQQNSFTRNFPFPLGEATLHFYVVSTFCGKETPELHFFVGLLCLEKTLFSTFLAPLKFPSIEQLLDRTTFDDCRTERQQTRRSEIVRLCLVFDTGIQGIELSVRSQAWLRLHLLFPCLYFFWNQSGEKVPNNPCVTLRFVTFT